MAELPESGQAGAIEITPAMIAAGVYEAEEHPLGRSLDELVGSVYIAMLTEKTYPSE